MKMVLRFKVRRPFRIGRRVFNSGYVSLAQIFPQAANLLAVGAIEDVDLDESMSGYVVLLKESPLGERGEVIAVEDLPWSIDRLEKACLVLRLFDAELNDVYTCRDCNKSFYGREQAIEHKERTGHKLRKREENT